MPTDACPTDDALYAIAEGEAPSDAIGSHVAECAECRARLERLRTSMSTIRFLYQQRPDVAGEVTERSPVPRFVGKYFVAGVLSEDDEFVVYRGVHSLLQAEVAIYASKHSSSDDETRDMLFAECRRLGDVRHESIARVLDVEMLNDAPALVVEFTEGRRFDQLIDSGDIDSVLASRVAHDVALALAALHRAGIAHGGLRSASIVIAADGRPVIADLGTSRLRRPPTTGNREDDVRSLGRIVSDVVDAISSRPGAGGDRRLHRLRQTAERALASESGDAVDAMSFAAASSDQRRKPTIWIVAGILLALVAFAAWVAAKFF